MKTITLIKRESIFKKRVAANLGLVCTLFVLLGCALSFLQLMRSISEEERIEQLKREELTAVANRMREISLYIDSGNIEAAKNVSLNLREQGILSSVSMQNRRQMYQYLSDVSNITGTENTKYAIYARICCECVIKELSGIYFALEEWGALDSDNYKLSAKNAISIAKSLTSLDRYPRYCYADIEVCTYNSNAYSKLNIYDAREFVDISKFTREQLDDSCDIGFLKARVRSHFGDLAGNEEFSFLFVDMGVAFFQLQSNNTSIVVGISSDGNEIYLYSEDSESPKIL